jgi:hypothetical protein
MTAGLQAVQLPLSVTVDARLLKFVETMQSATVQSYKHTTGILSLIFYTLRCDVVLTQSRSKQGSLSVELG